MLMLVLVFRPEIVDTKYVLVDNVVKHQISAPRSEFTEVIVNRILRMVSIDETQVDFLGDVVCRRQLRDVARRCFPKVLLDAKGLVSGVSA